VEKRGNNRSEAKERGREQDSALLGFRGVSGRLLHGHVQIYLWDIEEMRGCWGGRDEEKKGKHQTARGRELGGVRRKKGEGAIRVGTP